MNAFVCSVKFSLELDATEPPDVLSQHIIFNDIPSKETRMKLKNEFLKNLETKFKNYDDTQYIEKIRNEVFFLKV